MKKYIIYVGILLTGLLLGWVLFGPSSNQENDPLNASAEETTQMWTCAMHPHIMLPEPGDCPICGMDLIPVAEEGGGLTANQFTLTKNAMALADIQTTTIGNNAMADNAILLSGKIVENEEANTVQVSYFSGRIERLNVNFTGEEIRKGQLLATIYSPELVAAQQELITASASKESQPSLYNAVRNKLKLWKLSENQINQIETSGKVTENFPVYATVSGTVSEKLVAEGETVKQGQPLLKISNLSTVWAHFDVYENQIQLFKKNQTLTIVSNAYPNKTVNARISFIDPVLNTQTRTIKIRAVLDNKNDVFKPGMFVEGRVQGTQDTSETALLIPATAVLWTGKRSIVYVKANPEQPIFEMREVMLGTNLGSNYEIVEGLSPGEEIVTNGAFTVDAAAQLQGKKSMMNTKGNPSTTGHEGHTGRIQSQGSDPVESNLEVIDRIQVSSNFQEELKDVFNAYINVKNALVEDKSTISKTAADHLLKNLNKVNGKLLQGTGGSEAWNSIEKELKENIKKIAESTDIVQQRSYFKNVSIHLTRAVQLFGINQKVYNQFCPMADNNKGAYWLSVEKETFNPYFGSAMLKCGSVKQTIE